MYLLLLTFINGPTRKCKLSFVARVIYSTRCSKSVQVAADLSLSCANLSIWVFKFQGRTSYKSPLHFYFLDLIYYSSRQYGFLGFWSHVFVIPFNCMLSTNLISKLYLYSSASLVKIVAISRQKTLLEVALHIWNNSSVKHYLRCTFFLAKW